MQDSIAKIIAKIGTWIDALQMQKFLPIVLIGFMLLNTNVDPDLASKGTIDKLNRMTHQENPERPKTTAEWKQQARETKGEPVERAKRIGEQSADAVKEFGGMYPDVAKNSAKELSKSEDKITR